MGGDPRVLPPGVEVRPGGDPVDGVAVPLPAEHPAERRADPVGDHQPLAADLPPTAVGRRRRPRVRGPRPDHVDRLGGRQCGGAGRQGGPAQPVVQLRPGHRRAVRGQRATGPRQLEHLAEAVGPEPVVDRVLPGPRAEPQPVQLTHRPRGQPVAAGLVAREGPPRRPAPPPAPTAPPRSRPPTRPGRHRPRARRSPRPRSSRRGTHDAPVFHPNPLRLISHRKRCVNLGVRPSRPQY